MLKFLWKLNTLLENSVVKKVFFNLKCCLANRNKIYTFKESRKRNREDYITLRNCLAELGERNYLKSKEETQIYLT